MACKYGAKCRYSHESGTNQPQKSNQQHYSDTGQNNRQRQQREDTVIERSFKDWIRMMPRLDARFNQPVDLKAFFQKGYALVEDVAERQLVIKRLSEETGIQIIKTLTVHVEGVQGSAGVLVFKDCTLPFFRIISHPAVLSSLLLENQIAAIYTFLFGVNGMRGVYFFQKITAALIQMIGGPDDKDLSTIAVSATLAVLDKLIEINQSAQLIEEFTTIVRNISFSVSDDIIAVGAHQSLTRIKRRLNIGSTLPLATPHHGPRNTAVATFEMPQDLPGSLSSVGARHDNDHTDIAKIQILPTSEEIASSREEYLPQLESTKLHLTGLPGLLDRQFRLFREDTVGQLRDAVREEITRLGQDKGNASKSKQSQGIRKIVYHNIRFVRAGMDRRKGLLLEVIFEQPSQLKNKSAKQREDWWHTSKLLQVDSLVCLVAAAGRVIFLSVCDPIFPNRLRNDNATRRDHEKSTADDPSLSRDPQHASALVSLAEHNDEDVTWIFSRLSQRSNARQSLVEFPGVLLPSFRPTLQALQRMSQTLNLPFAEIISPDAERTNPAIQPPAYATRGFSFDLKVIAGEPLSMTPGRAFDFTKLEKVCTLDQAQQVAVIQALSTGLALIQGPPGTGKSYTGVAILKTLLNNRKAASLGPIICVCYTNHALDQLLEHLVNDSVDKIIRLGSRSKSELLQKITIGEVRKTATASKAEKSSKYDQYRAIDDILETVEGILPSLHNSKSWANIQAYLQSTGTHHLGELFGKGVDADGFREVKGSRFRVVDSWLNNAPRKLISNRPVPQLLNVPLNSMSAIERQNLHAHWVRERTAQLTDQLIEELETYSRANTEMHNCNSELDLRCLREAQVIGVTCSGLARNLNLLERVGAKVMLCEEAGEVLEAHILTALLPGIEHAILIGDHEQLRPQINNYELQSENPRGKNYSLDISLFERLVKSKAGAPQVPLSSLKTQRRMHPSISELVRVPLYPDLIDHSSVSHYPEVDGMRRRLFWLDHRQKEDQRTDEMVSQSRTNSFEVEMVAALVSHLVRQGTYGAGDIAVITPYLGQLQKIRKRLANAFEIVVGDRDQEKLQAEGFADDTKSVSGSAQVHKTTLLNALRLATVDNFQGEEAKVIIISLVRSNEARQCGFLKTSNRINVLLSRARHGMYILGNSDTAQPVRMWDEVLTILKSDNNIGQSLELCCPRHRDTIIEVSAPDDFVRFAPEGGCAEKCKERLSCGHACVNMCHSDVLHNFATRCLVRCPRTKKGCEHECQKVCGDRCDEHCQMLVSDIKLPCSHIATQVKCYQAQDPRKYVCLVEVQTEVEACGHKIFVKCHQVPLGIDHPCSSKCTTLLSCGHECTRKCENCSKKSEGKIIKTYHHSCRTVCKRPYTNCSHSCLGECHGDEPCPPCMSRCEVSCSHSNCSKLCHEPCAPCAENCSWSCPHRGTCQLPCAIPCDILPCSLRCDQLLSCGHQCPSICSERCPEARFCHICADNTVKETMVDFIEALTYAEINLDSTPCIIPPCGHILTLESMDGHMSMSQFYSTNEEGAIVDLKNGAEPFSACEMKSCPTCRAPLRSLNRYNRISRRALIDESTKKFIVWANSGFVPLITRMQELETRLRDGPAGSKKPSQPNLTIVSKASVVAGSFDEQFAYVRFLLPKDALHRSLINLRRDIKLFLSQVDEKEQPFGRIYDLAQDARRHRGIDADFKSHVDILQTRHRLLTTVLLIRCDYTVLVTFLESRENNGAQNLQIDLSQNRKNCANLIGESGSTKQPASTVEGHMYWARFMALESRFPTPIFTEDREIHLNNARSHLDIAKSLCKEFPGQTGGMLEEIDGVRAMLRGSTFYLPVSNEEKAAVYAAMARDFRGTGHWYRCQNGHPFTIGECGMPMETSRCPQCQAPVGGRDHRAVDGVTNAGDMDREFANLHVH